MLFRTRIFVVIFTVGSLPAVILLLVSAYLLNSTLDRVGASGLESSVEAARSMVDDSESVIGEMFTQCLSGEIPWSKGKEFDGWRDSKKLDLVYRKSNGSLTWSMSDSLRINAQFIGDLPSVSGLQHLEVDGNPLLIMSRADSGIVEGCGILMPEGYARRGRQLSNAVSATASLSIYKDFSIQLLSAVTGVSLIFILTAGFFISRMISGRLIKPLLMLTEGSRRLGAGDLDYRIDVSGNDEFANLARSFNEMAFEISENQKKLIQTERLAAWREVARRIAHEIKNPLTPITVELYRLKGMLAESGGGPSDITKALDSINTQIKELQELAGHFSTFAKEPELRKRKCSVKDILDETIRLHDNLDNVSITGSIPEDLPMIEMDPQMMGRVFGNIIKNSMEASPESVRVDIRVEKEDDIIKIVIKDSGPGFPPEKLENIDTPYITTKKSGTGLGLAIIKKIIDEHNGELKLYNDNGAVVEMLLPLI
ncbi:MAG: HAMP domain-containing protein [Candidatus Zixiibacteriota bacterium]|nr:MAG: HAMP domain-containing protein [candidate division Zixibacteria bacterium]